MQYTDRVYGAQEIDDALIIELINTKEMQRLKGIDQYGVCNPGNPKIITSRFGHSLGVYFLLRHFNASGNEQIAGLLHDVAHTAFSHVVDFVYKNKLQNKHEEWAKDYLKNSSIEGVLENNGINLHEILDTAKFSLLENELPDLCADRLDYMLRDAAALGFRSANDARNLLNAVIVNDSELIIQDKSSATAIGNLFLDLSSGFWASPLNEASLHILADAIRIALDSAIITEREFYLTDSELLEKLMKSRNAEIHEKLEILKNPGRIVEGTEAEHDFYTETKGRVLDPKFLASGKLKRLSDADAEFKQRAEAFKSRVGKGYYMKVTKA